MQPSNLKIVKFWPGTVGWECIKVNTSERTRGLGRVRLAKFIPRSISIRGGCIG
jgi:hypothetical protein